ncbi:MAG: hypothetical protein B6I29_05645 [Marinitoga sp. 4572_148]|nr:MAG: hypothetical protein B6I29_05645 [Marinitoga sp. 4572_148]
MKKGQKSILKINPNEFIDLCNELYPEAVLSLGWTTGPKKNGFFSKEQVSEMLFYVKCSFMQIRVEQAM